MHEDRPDPEPPDEHEGPLDEPRTLLVAEGVRKAFGPTQALAGVDLEVRAGEVHAIVGENGAGKSTLMKVLAGAHPPDAGRIIFDGAPFEPANPQEARDRGIAMIYQELNLAPHLSVEANIFLGMESRRFGFVYRRAQDARVREAMELLGRAEISPRHIVGELPVAQKQLVELARALVIDARLVVLDEPTSSLTIEDTERLFAIVERLRECGVSVLYISHFLEEVFRIADRFTVLRNGETVARGNIADVSVDQVVAAMVGQPLSELYPRGSRVIGEPVLELHDLSGARAPDRLSLTLRSGEILGLAGLVGSGRTETLRAVYGLDPIRSGTVRIGGDLGGWAHPHRRLGQGLGFLSENRKEEGLALDRSIADNMTLSDLSSVGRLGFVSPRLQAQRSRELIEEVGVRCRGPAQAVGELSGGNQQKVAIARLLHEEADVLLLDEPTRGIDVGSKVQVYRLMNALAEKGRGILFASSYLPELLGMCDRIAVLSRGRVVAVRDASAWTEHTLLLAATAAEDSP